MSAAREIAAGLTVAQRAAVLWLNGDGFVVGGLLGMGKRAPSHKAYLALKPLLEEHWTWASTTRPDCGLSALGKEVRTILLERTAQ